MEVPKSVLVPLIAAFTDDTSMLSEIRVARIVKFHKEHGAGGFLVNGETGDFFTLGLSERKELLEWVIRDAKGLPVWVNVTASTTSAAIDLCQHASRHGARGAVVSAPPIGQFYPHEIAAFVRSVQRHGNLSTVFADPDGKWTGAIENPSLEPAKGLAQSEFADWAQFERARPDEMIVSDGVVTPMALFGVDRLEAMSHNLPAYRPAFRSLIGHGGMSRGPRAALVQLGIDIGSSRSPVYELTDDGKKILIGMMTALGIERS